MAWKGDSQDIIKRQVDGWMEVDDLVTGRQKSGDRAHALICR